MVTVDFWLTLIHVSHILRFLGLKQRTLPLFKVFIYFYFRLSCVFVASRRPCLIAVSGLPVVRRLLLLQSTGSVVVARGLRSAGSAVVVLGLSYPAACEIFQDLVPCISRRILIH